MTKRDVCIWFCKVVALVGMINAGFGLIRFGLGFISANSGYNVGYMGAPGLFYPALSGGFHLFVWFFSVSLGTELAAEGEHGAPLSSRTEVGSLLMRCVGLWLFLNASINFGLSFLAWGYDYFTSRSSPAFAYGFVISNLVASFTQTLIGFFLAFTPRIRLFFGK